MYFKSEYFKSDAHDALTAVKDQCCWGENEAIIRNYHQAWLPGFQHAEQKSFHALAHVTLALYGNFVNNALSSQEIT